MVFTKLPPLVILVAVTFLSASARAQLPPDLKSDLGEGVPAFTVRPGYRVSRATAPKALKEARFIEFSDDHKTLFVSQGRNGTIAALSEPDKDGVFQKQAVFVKNKNSVQGMDFHNGWLYFSQASEGSISRARDTNGDGVADDVEVLAPKDSLPKGGGHPFEGLLVTDTQIFATASDPGNMTEELDSPRKTIYVFDKEGKNRKVFCTGIRNTEKLRQRPGTTEIWGFDHGSDNFGKTFGERTAKEQPITDLNPPEELNHYAEGAFYGHPYLSGNRVVRPEFADRKDIIELATRTTPPEWLVHAHWAVLGFTFITQDHFPDHKGDLFFAAHGSWNSVHPVGACIERVLFDNVTGKPYGSQTIVDGQPNEKRVARPVDCAEAADGTILFSTDEPPALFRISKSQAK
ncbi:MAG TPA: PQQ-dependent sugar dehydrogenase [Tepidisphaeraceae bacterium]|jgi:glucose/arabinose dehydrogenase